MGMEREGEEGWSGRRIKAEEDGGGSEMERERKVGPSTHLDFPKGGKILAQGNIHIMLQRWL